MSNPDLVDVMIHVDEDLNAEGRETNSAALRATGSVASVHVNQKTPHLFIVQYNPQQDNANHLLNVVENQNVHAELIGL